VGAARMAALCESLEQAANRQDWHGVDRVAPDLLPCARELRERAGQYR
jgi:HPt (histidine-containing phosphotransfer) domain-containing protein